MVRRTRNKNANKSALLVFTALFVILALLISNGLFASANAQESLEASRVDTYSYTQKELADLLLSALSQRGEEEEAGSPFDGFQFVEDEAANRVLIERVEHELQGTVLYTEQQGGATVMLLMNTEDRQLYLVAANEGDENHRFELDVESRGKNMPATVQVFALEALAEVAEELEGTEPGELAETEQSPVDDEDAQDAGQPEEADGQDGRAPVLTEAEMMGYALSGTANAPAVQSLSFMTLSVEEQVEQPEEQAEEADPEPEQPEEEQAPEQEAPEEADDEDIDTTDDTANGPQEQEEAEDGEEPEDGQDGEGPDEEAAEEAGEETGEPEAAEKAEEEELEAPEEEGETEYEVQAARTFFKDKTDGSYFMVLQPGEFGLIAMYTGMLNGGSLTGEVQAAVAFMADSSSLSGVDLETGSGSGSYLGGKLYVYSAADAAAQDAPVNSDFVTYSGTAHNVAYTIDENTDLVVRGISNNANRAGFVVELRNSRPVTIRSYTITSTHANTYTTFSGAVEGSVLNIENMNGPAVSFVRTINFTTGAGVSNAAVNISSANSYALKRSNTSSSAVNVNGDLTLGVSGHMGLYAEGALKVEDNARIVLEGTFEGGSALEADSNVTLNGAGRIELAREGDSAYDAISIRGRLQLNGSSALWLEDASTQGRSLYVKDDLLLNDNATVYAQSALEADPDEELGLSGIGSGNGDGGDIDGGDDDDDGDDDGDDGDKEIPEKDEDTIDNPELDKYAAHTSAVVYVQGGLRLNNTGNRVEVYGNAAQHPAEPGRVTTYALIAKGDTRVLNGARLIVGGAQVGLNTDDLYIQNGSAGDKAYATVDTLFETDKSVVEATGVYVGAIVRDYLRALNGANLYAEGGAAGLILRRTDYTHNISDTDRLGTTVIAVGTSKGSDGMIATQDAYFIASMRVVSVGDQNGIRLVQRASRVYARRFAEIIAIGLNEDGAGINYHAARNVTGMMRTYQAGKIYARGGMYGIYAENARIRSSAGHSSMTHKYADTRIIGIGGVDDANMEHTVDYLGAFSFNDLPNPVLTTGNTGTRIWHPDEIQVPGLVTGRPGSVGIVTGGNRKPYIRALNGVAQIRGFGGEYGIVNNSDALGEMSEAEQLKATGGELWARRGASVEGHGGRVGIQVVGRVYSYSSTNNRNAQIKGYGQEYGIIAGTYARARGYGNAANSHSYMYGIGTVNGIFAGSGIQSDNNTMIVGETWIWNEANMDPDDDDMTVAAMSRPAVQAYNRRGQINIAHRDGIVHEVYNPIGFVFSTPDPYQFNVEYGAVGRNMGNDPEVILDYVWTTPVDGPKEDPVLGLDFMNYKASDDQRLLYAGTGLDANGNSKIGLIATGYSGNADIVANNSKLKSRSRATGAVYGNGTHRITFRGVDTENDSTLQVRIDLQEMLYGAAYDVADLPAGLTFELDFTPDNRAGYDESELPVTLRFGDGDYEYDPVKGMLTFYKLRLGEYTLRAVDQYGWPYQALAEIPFIVCVDTRADANGPGGYQENWPQSSWIESVYAGHWEYKADGTRVWHDLDENEAKVTVRNARIGSPDNTRPTFTPPDGPAGALEGQDYATLYAKPSHYYSTLQVYYHREAYQVDMAVVDWETLYPIGRGAVSYRVYWDEAQNDAVTSTIRTVDTGSANSNVYAPQTVYADLTYKIWQSRIPTNYAGTDNEANANAVRFTRDADSGALYVVNESIAPNNENHVVGVDEDLDFHVWIRNDRSGTAGRVGSATLYLEDHEDLGRLLASGQFKLEANVSGSVWAEVYDGLVANGDGSFTMELRSRDYRLTQTATDPGFEMRRGYYQFKAEVNSSNNVRLTFNAGASTVPTEDDHNGVPSNGWSTVGSGYSNDWEIHVTNLYAAGNLAVTVKAEGIWEGHNDSVFLIELVGSNDPSDENYGKTYYGVVSLKGSNDLATYTTDVSEETYLFENILRGSYTVNVRTSLRTGNGDVQTGSGEAVRTGWDTVTFEFENESEHLLSGGAASNETFVIDFNG